MFLRVPLWRNGQIRSEKQEKKVRMIVSGTETEVASRQATKKKTERRSYGDNDVSCSIILDRTGSRLKFHNTSNCIIFSLDLIKYPSNTLLRVRIDRQGQRSAYSKRSQLLSWCSSLVPENISNYLFKCEALSHHLHLMLLKHSSFSNTI